MSNSKAKLRDPWWREWSLALAIITLVLALLGKGWIAGALDQPLGLVALLAVICGVILAAAIAIVRHAEVLAHRLGEPAGTLLLTLAITGLEVAMVAFVMSTGVDKPTLARDTMFAVVMLVLNGFLGFALLLGGPASSRATFQSPERECVSCYDPSAHRAGPGPAEFHPRDHGTDAPPSFKWFSFP